MLKKLLAQIISVSNHNLPWNNTHTHTHKITKSLGWERLAFHSFPPTTTPSHILESRSSSLPICHLPAMYSDHQPLQAAHRVLNTQAWPEQDRPARVPWLQAAFSGLPVNSCHPALITDSIPLVAHVIFPSLGYFKCFL